MRFQTFPLCFAVVIAIAACDETRALYTYSGHVVDRRGRPVANATVIGRKFGPTPDEVVVIGGEIVASDGTFELPSRDKLDEIMAVSRGGKHEVTLNNPKQTGNILVLP
jgi:hypothetical protein